MCMITHTIKWRSLRSKTGLALRPFWMRVLVTGSFTASEALLGRQSEPAHVEAVGPCPAPRLHVVARRSAH